MRSVSGAARFGSVGAAAALGLAALAACGKPCDPGARDAVTCGAAACPADSTRARGGCACAPGLDVLHGACVTPNEGNAYCGPAARWAGGRCVPRACPGGHPIDPSTGECAPTRALRAIALRDRIPLDDDQTLGCHDGSVLLSDGAHATCAPAATGCARGTQWNAGECAADRACPAGTVASPTGCVPLGIRGAAADGYTVDVSRWAQATLGPDGGAGTAILCRPLEQSPATLGVVHGAKGHIRIAIELIFPNNDVTQVSSRVEATERTEAPSGRPLSTEGAHLASTAVQTLVATLRALGGTASAASLTRTVQCAIEGGAPPMSVPLDIPQHSSSDQSLSGVR